MNGSVITFGSMLQTALGLAIVLAMVAGAAWLLKRLAAQPGGATGAIKVVAGAAIGQRERVVLVEVGSTWLVVGVAPGHVSALHTMPKAALEAQPLAPTTLPQNFAGWFRQIMEKRDGRA